MIGLFGGRRLLKISVVAAGISTSILVAAKNNDWDVSTIGVMRFGRAATTVCRIAADYKFSLKGLNQESNTYKTTISQVHSRSADRLLELCCVNGGAYIKVGQHIGALDYLLPHEYVRTMKILHSQAPKSSYEDVLRVIREDLQEEPNEIFSHFSPEPVGAASLAQVHKAVLHDGTIVAVKVQHPLVLRHASVDMKTMEVLVKIVSIMFPNFKFNWLVEETKRNLPMELKFLNEGRNAEKVAAMFKNLTWLKIPKIYWQYSTDRVLTMEFCEGGQINNKEYMTQHLVDVKYLSQKISELYSEMIFVQGYVHCDPHPGNLLVNQTQSGPSVILLDHGLYTKLSDDFRFLYSNLWLAMLRRDIAAVRDYCRSLGVGDMYYLLASMLTARSWKAVQTGIDKTSRTAKESSDIKTNAARFLPQITQVLENVPRQMILIFKTNDLLRGIEHDLTSRPGTFSFITMTKCCLKSVYLRNVSLCHSVVCRLRLTAWFYWERLKVNMYATYVNVKTSHAAYFFSISPNYEVIEV